MNEEGIQNETTFAAVRILFTDGTCKDCRIDRSWTIDKLTNYLRADENLAIAAEDKIIILYRGKVCDTNALLLELEPDLGEFTMHCLIRPTKIGETNSHCRHFEHIHIPVHSTGQISDFRLEGRTTDILEMPLTDFDSDLQDDWTSLWFAPEDSFVLEIGHSDYERTGCQRGFKGILFAFVFGFVLGFYLGIGPFVFMLLVYPKRRVLSGIVMGSLVYCVRKFME
jgi:hypothetical protein